MNHGPGIGSVAAITAALLALLLASGCASIRAPDSPGRVDPTLFPRSTSTVSAPVSTPVAVLSEPELVAYRKAYRAQDDWRNVDLPMGKIIEAAAVAALSDVLGQPVERLALGQEMTAAAPPGIRPVLVALRPVSEEVPIPGDRGGRVRLVLECRVLEADRHPVWSKRYDSGAIGPSTEQVNERYATLEMQRSRAVHRAAYAVMVEFARDLRRWLEAERLRERVL
jgi:hypothetical protein